MPKREQRNWLNIAGVVIILLAIAFAIFIAYSTNVTKVCETQECFILRAEQCAPAIIEVQDDDQIVTSRIIPDCSVSILIEYVDENGEKEVFSKKTCFYEKNKFAETILESDVVTCKTE